MSLMWLVKEVLAHTRREDVKLRHGIDGGHFSMEQPLGQMDERAQDEVGERETRPFEGGMGKLITKVGGLVGLGNEIETNTMLIANHGALRQGGPFVGQVIN